MIKKERYKEARKQESKTVMAEQSRFVFESGKVQWGWFL